MDYADQAELRLLGPTMVRRADGSVVEPSEWRSSKTLDLLRLLAVNYERPAQTEGILGQLWPDAPTKRAQASLRTATYQIRRVLGDDCVQRRGSTLQLNGVWFDAHRYWMLAAEVDVSRRSNTPQLTVALARDAEALYVADLEVAEPSEWLENARDQLRLRRQSLLLDAARAAIGLNWTRDALDFASTAHAIDPRSERAARALMRALGGLGEIEKALAVYERLRHDLADQFGADLSPQTRSLHLQLLGGAVNTARHTSVLPAPSTDEFAHTARVVLQGEPTDELLSSLRARSRGRAASAGDVARGWLAEGRIVWTVGGLALADAYDREHQPKTWRLQRLLRAMDWQKVDVLSVLALVDVEATAGEVGAVLARLHPGCEIVVPDVLDRLADTTLVEVGPGGYRLRSEQDRSEVVAWLRPAARHRLHRLIAELVDLDPLERARQLLAGGAHQAACDQGIDDLQRARDAGDTELAESLVEVLEQLPGRMRPSSGDRPLHAHLQAMA